MWVLVFNIIIALRCFYLLNCCGNVALTLSWRRPLSYRNHSIDLLCKSMDWFLYDNGLRHEKVNHVLAWEQFSSQYIMQTNISISVHISKPCGPRFYPSICQLWTGHYKVFYLPLRALKSGNYLFISLVNTYYWNQSSQLWCFYLWPWANQFLFFVQIAIII